ncbi:hypothetical protein P7L74_01205 (plasmid) [Tistrella mobilis]|uniref:hypothetical protein n=1 Tax=Tistrella mobilis TaxID=171437 RepID=UPI003556144B
MHLPRLASFALISSSLLLSACGDSRGVADAVTYATMAGPWTSGFSCADGTRLKIRYEDSDVVIRTGDGETFVLPAVDGEAGRYETNRNTFINRGSGAVWVVAGRPTDCVAA